MAGTLRLLVSNFQAALQPVNQTNFSHHTARHQHADVFRRTTRNRKVFNSFAALDQLQRVVSVVCSTLVHEDGQTYTVSSIIRRGLMQDTGVPVPCGDHVNKAAVASRDCAANLADVDPRKPCLRAKVTPSGQLFLSRHCKIVPDRISDAMIPIN